MWGEYGFVAVREIRSGFPMDENEIELLSKPYFTVETNEFFCNVQDAIVPVDTYKKMISKLARSRIQLHGLESGAGLDGTRYGIDYKVNYGHVHLEWWENRPKEWLTYTNAVHELQDYLHSCVEETNKRAMEM